ncbi:MAG: menC [Acidimicrobiaceae bacterium]|nr:menC [Acidimicrobiaceae bacterium]
MRVEAVELRSCALELVRPVATSAGRHEQRPVVLVRLGFDDGSEGWGECDALLQAGYSAEYSDGAAQVLADQLVPRIPARDLDRDDPVADALSGLAAVPGHPMAKASLEMALLDGWLSAGRRSLADFLGATSQRVPGGATIGLGTTEEVLGAARLAVEAGYTRLKCKIAPGRELDQLGAVRDAFPDVAVCADANGAYRLDDEEHRRRLGALDSLGLVALEQPLAPDDLAGHAVLAAELATPVLLDESVGDEGQLAAAVALGALDGLVVKPGRLGGVLAARRVHDACVVAGLHLVLGGMFEAGIARAAHLAVAALPGFDLPGDLGGSDRYFHPDLTRPHVLEAGMLAVPDEPGIGRRPEISALLATTRRIAIGRPGEALSWAPA